MNLVGWHLVDAFCQKHPKSKTGFDNWAAKVAAADPANTADFKSQIGHKPDFPKSNLVIFEVNSDRVVCSWPGAQYRGADNQQILVILPEFPAIHSDYDIWWRRNLKGGK